MEKKTVAVLGMMCSACAANVDKRLNVAEGVVAASVNLAGRTATIEYDPERTSLAVLQKELSAIGYDMVIEEDRNIEALERNTYTQLRKRVVLSWLFAIAVMLLSMGVTGMPMAYANQTALILSLLNIVYCGRQFYVNAIRQLCHGSASMDTLVALSTAVSFVFSAIATFWGDKLWGSHGLEWHTYYDASVMIITFVLTGRLLEERAKQGTAGSIRSLMGLQPKVAHLLADDGQATDIPIAAVGKGDRLEVRVGEKIPVDGIVDKDSDNTVIVDESMMTGEAIGVGKAEGGKVLAGTLLHKGRLVMKAQAVGKDTVLANMIRLVQQAQGSKAPVQRTVDRIALVFVPTVVALSVLTFMLWLVIGGSSVLPQAVLAAVAVLVIACPCAMGLATPTALMVGMGKAAERGILIKDATALEELRRITAMVVDKTGTITDTPSQQAIDGNMPTEESLRPQAKEAIGQLQRMGVDIYMMSGDQEERVASVAQRAGIRHWQSRVMPQDKAALVARLRDEGHRVAMVGDGINDSQALATADVSIAMGQGTDVAMDVAQLTLMSSDLRRIPEAMALSRRTVAMIHQNLFWAFIYNMVCIPLAAGLPTLMGFSWQVTPMWASALMAFSSVSVVLNSLRLKYQS